MFACSWYVQCPWHTWSQMYELIWIMNPYCMCCKLTPLPSPQAVSVTITPSAVILTRRSTRLAGGGVEVCVRAACTTPQGQSVTSVCRATSQTATEWTTPTPAYVSGSSVKWNDRSFHYLTVEHFWCNLWRVFVLVPGCVCSADGTVNGGRCEDSTGSCLCKVNVEGPRCDRCKRGFSNLSPSNPQGCSSESSNYINIYPH